MIRSVPLDICLVTMPFAEVQRPSIALGLLQASLRDTPIRSDVVYGNFPFAETIGLVAYQAMQSGPTDYLLGEWCFSEGLVAGGAPDDEEYLDMVLGVRCHGFPPDLEQRKDLMRWVRAQTGPFLDRLAEEIVAREPRIVGCSSVFQQHCASLALLRRVRALSPDTVTLMGGANCEDEMGVETLRVFPWVDCVVSGEADDIFRDLCATLLEHGRDVDPDELPEGAISRAHLRKTPVAPVDGPTMPRSVVHDLDAIPTPDYDRYFERLSGSTLQGLIQPGLLAESSRGCWWGSKSPCTFCGLNGAGLAFRSKSPKRVLSELSALSGRYGIRSIQFVDNILDMKYLKTVLPKLASADDPYTLFFETKANLKRKHVRLLAEAGVRWIQPGIESLNDDLLRLLGKGNTTHINLQLLKWTAEYGIETSWNMLSGVPGESDSWSAEMAEWLPAIFHLQPASGVGRVRYDRFSLYHLRPEEFGLDLEPSRAYRYVYPLPDESLMRLAYSFEDRNDDDHIHRGLHRMPGRQRLQRLLSQWIQSWYGGRRPVLHVRDDGDRLKIVDTRPWAGAGEWTAGPMEAQVYRLCDTAKTPKTILRKLCRKLGRKLSMHEIEPAITTLRNGRVLLHLYGKLLGIGVNVKDRR